MIIVIEKETEEIEKLSEEEKNEVFLNVYIDIMEAKMNIPPISEKVIESIRKKKSQMYFNKKYPKIS